MKVKDNITMKRLIIAIAAVASITCGAAEVTTAKDAYEAKDYAAMYKFSANDWTNVIEKSSAKALLDAAVATTNYFAANTLVNLGFTTKLDVS